MKRYIFLISTESLEKYVGVNADNEADAWIRAAGQGIAEYGRHLKTMQMIMVLD